MLSGDAVAVANDAIGERAGFNEALTEIQPADATPR